jgi:hypothetical protein
MKSLALVVYVLRAILTWSPPVEHHEPESEVLKRYVAIATDIAEVAADGVEAPLVLRPGVSGPAPTAILLTSLAFHEGRFFKFVDEGACNRKGYKADRRGTCDNGRAFSIFQIQPGRGLALQNGEWTWWTKRSTGLRIVGEDLLRDRRLATRVALHMARQSMTATRSLCVYSGEPCKGLHPNADARLMKALSWVKAHPFGADDPLPEPVLRALNHAASGRI